MLTPLPRILTFWPAATRSTDIFRLYRTFARQMQTNMTSYDVMSATRMLQVDENTGKCKKARH